MFLNSLLNFKGENSRKWSSVIAISISGFLSVTNVYATEVHSDVEFGFVGGTIEIEPSAEGFVFEADFLEAAPFTETDDPGFNSDEFFAENGFGAATPGTFVGFNVLGPLQYWDGDSFESVGSASISISDVQGPADVSVIDGSTTTDLASFSGGLENILGQADGLGLIHNHLDFELFNGVLGAYGILMSLTTDQAGITDSITFGLFFNNGLGELAFEEGVEAFNAQVVPIPAGVWLFASAIGLLLPRARKQS